MTDRFTANVPRFVDETIDGEALIMDMVKGFYYTCTGASTVAWNALKRGSSIAEVAVVLSSTYPIAVADATRDLERFVATLLSEELLVEAGDSSDRPTPTPDVVAGDSVPVGGYAELGLERFTDLADLIVLDPVHDVTDAGWPNASDNRNG